MKLVEIKDVRPGQIRKVTAYNNNADEFQTLAVIEMSGIGDYAEYDTYAEFYDAKTKKCLDNAEELNFYEDGELIGFLDITHRIESNKLVEIPRAEFEVDDVVQLKDGTQRQYIVQRKGVVIKDTFPNSKCYQCFHYVFGIRNIFDFEIKKIGILGVTQEFVNERLAK